jgi:hypothetical protein
LRGGRYTKFEENQTNFKRVILPAASSASSGDLRPDVSWRQSDVRPDVTTKLGPPDLRPDLTCVFSGTPDLRPDLTWGCTETPNLQVRSRSQVQVSGHDICENVERRKLRVDKFPVINCTVLSLVRNSFCFLLLFFLLKNVWPRKSLY